MKIIPHVMVLDGNPTILQMVKTILEMEDFQVTTCELAEELRREVKNSKPALIICDIPYAGVDGRDICKAFKADPETAGIPFIIFTAQPNCRSSSLTAGADFFIEKPFDIELLCQRVREAALLAKNQAAKSSDIAL